MNPLDDDCETKLMSRNSRQNSELKQAPNLQQAPYLQQDSGKKNPLDLVCDYEAEKQHDLSTD